MTHQSDGTFFFFLLKRETKVIHLLFQYVVAPLERVVCEPVLLIASRRQLFFFVFFFSPVPFPYPTPSKEKKKRKKDNKK